MTRRFLIFIAMMVLTGGAHPLAAQRLRAQVLLPDSTTPAKGVIVVATGDGPAGTVRGLTNQRGEAELPLSRAGRYQVRVLRIGFRPTVAPPVDVVAGEARSLRIVLTAEPISLARVTVREQDVCRTRPDSGALVARAWEEARKALLASQLSALGARLVAEWIVYDRTLDAAARNVREQHVHTTTSPTTHAFTSWPAESLAARGYVVADLDVTTHYAPDPDVLLSESFASLHCFQLKAAPAGRDDLVGVGFRPVDERRGLADIEGTLWLDRATAELRWLDYRYTGLPAAATRAGAGGKVEFLLLASGTWLVSRWNIRMARLGAAERLTDAGTRRVIVAPNEAALRGVSIGGGQVTRVHRGDSLVYEATGARFEAQLVSSDSAVPVGGATVRLLGSDYEARTDALGRAHLSPVLEGRYRVRVQTPFMELIGATRLEREVEVREGIVHVDTIALPTAVELLRLACGNDAAKPQRLIVGARVITLVPVEGLLYGTVRDSLGHPAAGAAVTVTWQGSNLPIVDASEPKREQSSGMLTDQQGRWKLCGLPLRAPLLVRVVTDAGVVERRESLSGADLPLSAVDLVLHRPEPATGGPAGGRSDVVLEISVSDRAGTPLTDVTLDVTPSGGAPPHHVLSSELGRTLLLGLKPGMVTVRARGVGYKPGEVTVALEAGRNAIPIILDKVRLPSLDTVRVLGGRRVSSRLDAFETRRARGEATASIGRDEIERRNPLLISQLLQNVPAVHIEWYEGKALPYSARGLKFEKGVMVACYMAIMVDGVAMPARTSVDQVVPREVHGIEVFAGAASIPLNMASMLNGNWCGLIAIWTR